MLTGYKTYICAAVMAGLAAAEYFGFAIPAEAWLLLNAMGLGFLRAAVSTETAKV